MAVRALAAVREHEILGLRINEFFSTISSEHPG
jgi:hypothetical protein